jgi:hypothetical protein
VSSNPIHGEVYSMQHLTSDLILRSATLEASRSTITPQKQLLEDYMESKSRLVLGLQDMLVWFGLWCLMPLSTIFQLYLGSQCYWWRKLEYTERTPPTCHKSLKVALKHHNPNTAKVISCIFLHWIFLYYHRNDVPLNIEAFNSEPVNHKDLGSQSVVRGCYGHDHMVVGFTTTIYNKFMSVTIAQ